VVDKYHALIEQSFRLFGISFDYYGRTTSPLHHQTASAFFRKLYDKGVFEERETEQYYDEQAQQFLADRYIYGTCPRCGYDNAYGDQCEKCGTSLAPTDLINPKSVLSGTTPVKRLTRNWFLPLNKLQPKIEAFLSGHTDWKPNVYGQCRSWLDTGDGLQPRSMTRDLDWGIPVPVEGAAGKVLYVWFDAPIGYISNTKEYFLKKSKEDSSVNSDDWKIWWQDEGTRLIHFIGKDNIVFHCIIFPAMLIEHGDFVLPDQVPANEFLNLEGEKISTSRNHAVWLHEYLEDFPDKQDMLRYTLCANMPETKDNDFTWKDFQTKNNSELVGILGNLVNRAITLADKYFEGKVPDAQPCSDLQSMLGEQKAKIEQALERFRFREGLQELMNIARAGNKLLADKEPWKLIKHDKAATAAIVNDALQIVANLALLMEPFLPFTSARLRDLLNMSNVQFKWDDAGKCDLLASGHALKKPQLLFEKIEDEIIMQQINKLQPMAKESASLTQNNETLENQTDQIISFEEFSKIDLRVGTVLAAERVEKADKLLKLTVDMGLETRTIVSGIAQFFSPESLIGKRVCVVANLAPRKIRGIESKGMILLAEKKDGSLSFVVPEEEVPNGSSIK
ncbi:MAG: methionine--tRNA ligase, partial [Chitinophagales bacterium]|nr:methionine--tRNA ligase [Chitinophagales bacterium]